MDFVKTHWMQILVLVNTAVLLAAAYAKKTENKWDDKVMNWAQRIIKAVLDLVSLGLGKQPKPPQ